jgi:hypothetical protein
VVDSNLNMMSLRVEFPEIVKYINSDLESSLNWADLVVVNKREVEKIIEMTGNVKIIINCINNEKYTHLTNNVYNLF